MTSIHLNHYCPTCDSYDILRDMMECFGNRCIMCYHAQTFPRNVLEQDCIQDEATFERNALRIPLYEVSPDENTIYDHTIYKTRVRDEDESIQLKDFVASHGNVESLKLELRID